MSSVPAKQFDMAVYVRDRVQQMIVPLLPKPEDWPSFAVALQAALIGNPKLKDAFAANPNSGMLAIIKCARLGMSLDPAMQHFALIPYGEVVEGQPMYKGWQHLVLSSGNVEWMAADVVYKQEVQKDKPFFDPDTQHANHVPAHFERDQWKDDDIVGAYCTIKVRDSHRLVSRLLTRGEINKRRAASKAPNSPGWTKWFAQMCLAKAIKAVCSSGRISLTPQLRSAIRADDDNEIGPPPGERPAGPLPTSPQPVHTPPPKQQTGGEYMFAARDKDPLPTDDDHRRDLLGAIATEEVRQDLTRYGVAEIAAKALGRKVDEEEVERLTAEELDKVLTALLEGGTG